MAASADFAEDEHFMDRSFPGILNINHRVKNQRAKVSGTDAGGHSIFSMPNLDVTDTASRMVAYTHFTDQMEDPTADDIRPLVARVFREIQEDPVFSCHISPRDFMVKCQMELRLLHMKHGNPCAANPARSCKTREGSHRSIMDQ